MPSGYLHHAPMAFASVTRLRVRSLRHMPLFSLHTLRVLSEARRASRFVAGSLLADRKLTFWTMTVLQEQSDMRDFMTHGAHLKAMPMLLDWCDEASVVHWVQDQEKAPSWLEADTRMRNEGRPSKVRHPSPHHATLAYDVPRTAVALSFGPSR